MRASFLRLLTLNTLIGLGVASPASATLVGDTVQGLLYSDSDFYYPPYQLNNRFNPGEAVVTSPGTEFLLSYSSEREGFQMTYFLDTVFSLNIEADTIHVNYTLTQRGGNSCQCTWGGGNGGFKVAAADLDLLGIGGPGIGSVDVLSSNGFTLFDFDSYSITFLQAGVYLYGGEGADGELLNQSITVKLTPIPEPAPSFLLAFGVLALALSRSRTRRG